MKSEKGKGKRISAIVLIVTTAILIYFFHKILPDIYSNLGQKAYEHGDYSQAYSNLKTAVQLSPKNRDARYYLVQTLIKLPPTLAIQKELYKISQANLADSADLIADRQISKWRNQISFNAGENYIEQVPFNDKILRWDAAKFPLTVSIENDSPNNLPQYYKEEIEKAFLQWQSSTNNFISFKFIEDPKNAQISVKIISTDQREKCKEQECKYVMAFTMPYIKGDLLQKMEITFYDSNNLAQPFSEKEIYNTALHEIGHSLGIMGHSYNKDDLMYMEENSQKDVFEQSQSDFQLISPNDLNTLNLLYKLIPDITNTDLNEFDTSRQFFAPIVMGSNEQINSRKMLEAQNYINSAPNLPNGYIDLSAAYAEQKEYNSAIEALNKALELSSSDNEKYVIYYNFAVIYMNIRDWDDSLKYAQLAKQTLQGQPPSSSNSDIDGLIAGINFNKGNKAFAKQAYIESLEKNPGSEIDAINLAIIYLKEFNFIQAGKTLNRLVEANPDAKNDPKIKAYWLLMFFFK